MRRLASIVFTLLLVGTYKPLLAEELDGACRTVHVEWSGGEWIESPIRELKADIEVVVSSKLKVVEDAEEADLVITASATFDHSAACVHVRISVRRQDRLSSTLKTLMDRCPPSRPNVPAYVKAEALQAWTRELRTRNLAQIGSTLSAFLQDHANSLLIITSPPGATILQDAVFNGSEVKGGRPRGLASSTGSPINCLTQNQRIAGVLTMPGYQPLPFDVPAKDPKTIAQLVLTPLIPVPDPATPVAGAAAMPRDAASSNSGDDGIGFMHGRVFFALAISCAIIATALVVLFALKNRNNLTSDRISALTNAEVSRFWFETVPLEFDRSETNVALKMLTVAYPNSNAILALSDTVGLKVMHINFTQGPGPLMREIMKQAALENKLKRLLEVALSDSGVSALHDRLAELLKDKP